MLVWAISTPPIVVSVPRLVDKVGKGIVGLIIHITHNVHSALLEYIITL